MAVLGVEYVLHWMQLGSTGEDRMVDSLSADHLGIGSRHLDRAFRRDSASIRELTFLGAGMKPDSAGTG